MAQINVKNLVRRPIHEVCESSPSSTYSSEFSNIEEEDDDCDSHSNSFDSPSPTKSERKGLYPDLSNCDSEISSSPEKTRNESPTIQSKKLNKDTNQKEIKSPDYYFWIAIVFVACIAVALFYYMMPGPQSNVIDAIMAEMKKKFPKQSEVSYKVLKTSLKRAIDQHPPSCPAVLLLIGSRENKEVIQCFSTHLSQTIVEYSNAIGELIIDGSSLRTLRPSQAKLEIDEKIKQNFSNNRVNVLHFKNFDLVPGEAAMMLHGYCDHENAPFKQSVIILDILTHQMLTLDLSNKVIDKYARDHLRDVWNELDVDYLEPLFSRITRSVVGIVPEILPSVCS